MRCGEAVLNRAGARDCVEAANVNVGDCQIKRAHANPCSENGTGNFQRGGLTQVIGVWFKCEPEKRDFGTFSLRRPPNYQNPAALPSKLGMKCACLSGRQLCDLVAQEVGSPETRRCSSGSCGWQRTLPS